MFIKKNSSATTHIIVTVIPVMISLITRSSPIAIDVPPPSAYVDTEAATNIVFDAGNDWSRTFNLAIELNQATTSNNIEVAFGTDANTNNVLDRVEVDAIIGWDSGAWFYQDRRAGVFESELSDGGSTALDSRLTLDSRRNAKSLVATVDGDNVFTNTIPATMFSPKWNLMRVTTRGLIDPRGIVVTQLSVWGFRIHVR